MTIDFRALWGEALPYETFVRESDQHRGLWEGIHRIARVPAWAPGVLPDGIERRRLLVIAEDWCGDASNTIPILAKWAEHTPGLDLRVIRRDEYPEVMDRYLTNGARAIPVVIVLDEDFAELGHWGPRPDELQTWVQEHRRRDVSSKELYPRVRRWYARDRGNTTVREIAALAGLEPMASSA